MSKRAHLTLWTPMPLLLAFGCTLEGAKLFMMAKLIMRKALDLFLGTRALTLGPGVSKIAGKEVDLNG
jgi:hypothetical protein